MRHSTVTSTLLGLALAASGSLVVPAASARPASTPPAHHNLGRAPTLFHRFRLPQRQHPGFIATGQSLTRAGSRTALHGRPADPTITMQVPHGHRFVIPRSAVPYAGGKLDLSLFDATLAMRRAGARLPVRIGHTGNLGGLPGIRITRDSGGVAAGYLTAGSARVFGAALAADGAALLGKVDSMSLPTPHVARVAAARRYPMRTVELTVTNADERTGGLMFNLDDSRRWADALWLVPGRARVSVPVGHYHVFAYNVSAAISEGGSGINRLIELDFEVTSDAAVQQVTLDMSQATSKVSLTQPSRPVETVHLTANYARVDAPGTGRAGLLYEDETPYELRVQPYADPAIGAIDYSVLVSAFEHNFGDASSSYLYHGLYPADRIAPDQTYSVNETAMATVDTELHGDRAGVHEEFVRIPLHPTTPMVRALPLVGGLRRTEYVDFPAGLESLEESVGDLLAEDASFMFQTSTTIYDAGASYHHVWHGGPLAPGFEWNDRPNSFYDTYCLACRTRTQIGVGMDPVTDSDPTHFGLVEGFVNGTLPTAVATLSRNGVLVHSSDNATGVVHKIPTTRGHYALTVDEIRYTAAVTKSTRSHTRLTFDSAAGQGPKAPAAWHCGGCTVLPVLTAKVAYPENLIGEVQPGVSRFDVNVGRVPGAAPANATAVTVWVRPSSWGWAKFPATQDSAGHWHADVDLPQWLGRSTVDVRVVAKDDGGSSWDQTVERAFTLMAPILDRHAVAAGAAGRAGSSWQRPVVRNACGAAPGGFRCLAQWRPGAGPSVLAPSARTDRVGRPEAGYGPTQIQSIYGLDPHTPGMTVAIVDAFDYPNAERDLAVYRKAWGLPACTTANGCFRKVDQRGGTDYPDGDPGWALEAALDLQAVSAACPRCHLLLVESDTNMSDDMGAAVNQAVALGATIVSNSYGSNEGYDSQADETAYYTHPGVAQLAASGDNGFRTASFPAVSSQVIAVGGTTVTKSAKGWRQRAWSFAGSGCSAFFDKPTYQRDPNCLGRTVSDVSALADPATGLAVYDTYALGPYKGWLVVGGTSLAAPLMAGMVAQAGNPQDLDQAEYLYRHAKAFVDVSGGRNGVCGGDYLCTGLPGYDAPTGLGTPYHLRGL